MKSINSLQKFWKYIGPWKPEAGDNGDEKLFPMNGILNKQTATFLDKVQLSLSLAKFKLG